jgi:long-chain acyl-CoA synthetase
VPTKGFYAYANAEPGAPCLVDANGCRTRGEVLDRINRVANGLRALGLRRDDHVCLLVGNRSEFLEVVAASGISGTFLTAVNWHLTPEETSYIVDDCDASVLLLDTAFADVGLRAAAAAARVRTVISIGGHIDGAMPFDEWIAAQPATPPADEISGGQMLYSSGTTGRPKGVARQPFFDDPDQNFEMGERLRELFPSVEEGSYLVTGPFYHAAPYGYTVAAFHRGAKIVIMDRWTPEATLDLIEEHRVDTLHLVPTMFRRLLALQDERKRAFDPSSLVMAIHGAAPCPPSVKKAMIDWWGPVIYEYYGATEGGLTLVRSEEWLERPGTVGKALPFWNVVALDDDGNEISPSTEGTIYFKTLVGRTFEYYKDPDKTARAHRGADLFTLGDVGYVDDDGYVFITDRKADMIISGGVNVYPAEVESCLHAHPVVADVAVIGVPSEEWGEEVKAVVQLAEGNAPSDELAAEIIAFARDRIARFKCPRSVDFVDALPRTDAGKLYKRRLRERYWAEAGRTI